VLNFVAKIFEKKSTKVMSKPFEFKIEVKSQRTNKSEGKSARAKLSFVSQNSHGRIGAKSTFNLN